jgi:hypothetical protein
MVLKNNIYIIVNNGKDKNNVLKNKKTQKHIIQTTYNDNKNACTTVVEIFRNIRINK